MPQPRKYESNAARQKAYRDRLRARAAARTSTVGPGAKAIVDRVMAADERARGEEDAPA